MTLNMYTTAYTNSIDIEMKLTNPNNASWIMLTGRLYTYRYPSKSNSNLILQS